MFSFNLLNNKVFGRLWHTLRITNRLIIFGLGWPSEYCERRKYTN